MAGIYGKKNGGDPNHVSKSWDDPPSTSFFLSRFLISIELWTPKTRIHFILLRPPQKIDAKINWLGPGLVDLPPKFPNRPKPQEVFSDVYVAKMITYTNLPNV